MDTPFFRAARATVRSKAAASWVLATIAGMTCTGCTEVVPLECGPECAYPCSEARQVRPLEMDGGTVILAELGMDTSYCEACVHENVARLKNSRLLQCACAHCAAPLAACRGEDGAGDSCRGIINCGLTNDCAGTDCYCGRGSDRATCKNEGPSGPCRGHIARVAGCSDELEASTDAGAATLEARRALWDAEVECVLAAEADPGSPLHRARDVSRCTGDPFHGHEGRCLDAFDAP